MAGFDLSDYVPVAERIALWYERHPDGRIVTSGPELMEVGGKTFVVMRATVYQDPADLLPSTGIAWEPFPGPTPYTRDSELMNAETSAVGRALAMAGIEARRGIASLEDVQNRSTSRVPREDVEHLKSRLKNLPDYMQPAVREMVKAGPRIETMTAEQLDMGHEFVTLLEDEVGAPFVADVDTAGKT